MQRIAILANLAAALGGAGCLPFASPPVTLSVGGGGAFGTLAGQGDRRQELGEAEPIPELRATVMPLGMSRSLHGTRRFDVGLSYVLEGGSDAFLNHGPAVMGSWYLLQHPAGSDALARLALDLSADVLWSRDAGSGGGGSLGLRFDVVTFTGGAFHTRRSDGYALGEAALGVYVRGGARAFRDMGYGTISAGVLFTLPLAVGVVALR